MLRSVRVYVNVYRYSAKTVHSIGVVYAKVAIIRDGVMPGIV